MNRHSQSLQYALRVLGQDKYKRYIRAIYLYGSCARGEQRYWSDVDLFVVLYPEIPKSVIRSMRIDVVPDSNLPEVELKTSLSDNFSTSRQFNENMKKEGKLLWERV